MAEKDIMMLSRREVNRLHIVKKAIEKQIKQREAAEILLMTERQIRRLINEDKRRRRRGNSAQIQGEGIKQEDTEKDQKQGDRSI